MHYLYTPEGEAALAAVVSRRPLLAFDFDGTLTPIVSRPEDARLDPAVAAQLAALGRRLPLAILTGRRCDDVRERLGFEPTFVVGGHGAEDESGLAFSPPMRQSMRRLREHIGRHATVLHDAGVTIEDKGSSMALHYRLAPDHDRALDAIQEALTPLAEGLRVFGGKRVVNIMPRDAPNKADAVLRLLARCNATALLFAGDDLNDEPVFKAAQPGWLTIHVGNRPSKSRAQYFLAGPDEVVALLGRVAALLPAQ